MLGVLFIYIFLARQFGVGLERINIGWFEDRLASLRKKLGSTGFCIALALLGLLFSIIYVRLDTHVAHLGFWYAKLSETPFDLTIDNQVGYRRLTPTISYLLGLTGRKIIITNLLFAGGLLFAVARYFIARTEYLVDVAFAVAALTFSLVTLTTIHCGGYTDSATYLLIFLIWWFRHRAFVFYPMFLLGLLNRESIGFLLPWFVLIRIQAIGRSWRLLPDLVVGFGATFLIYWLYRDFVGSQADIVYSAKYYLESFLEDPLYLYREIVYFHGLGVFSVYGILWLFPALAIIAFLRDRNWAELLGFALILTGCYAQTFIAGDTSRMMTMAFMVMPIGLLYLLRENRFGIRHWAGWVFLANLAVPVVYTAFSKIEIWQPQWRAWLMQALKN